MMVTMVELRLTVYRKSMSSQARRLSGVADFARLIQR